MKKNSQLVAKESLRIGIVLLFLIASGFASAQTLRGTLTGTVKDDKGKALAYATVAVSGTSKGTVTSENGTYSIQLPAGDYTIVFSFTGYHSFSKEVSINAGKTVNMDPVVLKSDSKVLNEIKVDGMITKFSRKQTDMVARMPLKNLENPQVYTVVPKELLTEQVSTDLETAISSAPGISNVGISAGSGGTGLALTIRGFSLGSLGGAIRNGMATNYVSLSDPSNLERLEVIKGPSATLFGSTLVSYGGLVNRVTKKAHKGKNTSLEFNAGNNYLGRYTIDFNAPLNDDNTFLFRVNAALTKEASFQDYGRTKTTFIAPTFTYHASDRLTIDFDGEYYESHRTTTLTYFSSFISNLDQLDWDFSKSYTSNDLLSSAKVLNAFAKASYKLSDKWTSETAVSNSNTDNNAYYLFLFVTNADSLMRRIMNNPSVFHTLQVQQNFIGHVNLGFIKNRFLLGLDYTQMKNVQTRTYVNYDYVTIGETNYLNVNDVKSVLDETDPALEDYERNQETYSAYGSDVINFTDNLIAMVSLRVDHFNDIANDYKQTSLSPKMGLIYRLFNQHVSLFGNYMNGFTNVAPSETKNSLDKEVKMKPEHANQLEGGIKYQLFKGKLSGTLSYYDIEVKDIERTVTDDDNNSYSVQDGTQYSKGIDFDLIANPVKGMHIIVGYGYNNSVYQNVSTASYNGNHPYSTPKHVANLWFSHRLTKGNLDGLGFGFGGNYQSKSFYDDANTITVPGFLKLDGTIFYEKKSFRLGLKLNNMANEKYWVANYWATPQKTRNFVMNFTIRF